MLHVRQCQDGTESGQAPQCFVRQSRTGLGCGGQLPFDAPVVDQIVSRRQRSCGRAGSPAQGRWGNGRAAVQPDAGGIGGGVKRRTLFRELIFHRVDGQGHAPPETQGFDLVRRRVSRHAGHDRGDAGAWNVPPCHFAVRLNSRFHWQLMRAFRRLVFELS